jgi:hypothetical protein
VSGERIKLTGRSVEGQAPAEHGDLFLWDSEVLGFGVNISAAGRRSYILQYRFGGRARRYTIGAHGSPWTPDTARDQAKILMGQISAGEDPQEAKLGARREMTVAELCDLYLAEGLATRKSTSIASARSDIENHIKPCWGPSAPRSSPARTSTGSCSTSRPARPPNAPRPTNAGVCLRFVAGAAPPTPRS